MRSSLAARIMKLERRYKPDDGAFFVVWASEEADIDSAIGAARSALLVGDGDIVISAVWPRDTEPRPSTRWVLKRDCICGLEGDVLLEMMIQKALAVDQVAAAILIADPMALEVALSAKIETRDGSERHRGKALVEYTDAELFAEGLGRPLVTEDLDPPTAASHTGRK